MPTIPKMRVKDKAWAKRQAKALSNKELEAFYYQKKLVKPEMGEYFDNAVVQEFHRLYMGYPKKVAVRMFKQKLKK